MAKAGKAKTALKLFQEYQESGAPQPGMFSPLIEAVRQAPMKKGTGQAWMEYLQPGRMVNREGIQFPIKQTEIDLLNIDDIDADMGLGAFIAPNTKYTKEEIIKELSAQGETRPSMSLNIARQITNPLTGERIKAGPETVIPEAWVQGATEASSDPLKELRRLEVEATKYGQNRTGTSQLSHVSPGSTYEESISRLPGLVDESQHFARDTVSHSRSSTHPNTEVGKVRLVEEIQADVHQKAADKLYRDPQDTDGLLTEREVLRELSPEEVAEALEDGTLIYEGRRGYMDAEQQMNLEMIVDDMEELNAQKSAIRRGEVSDLLGGELGEGMGTAAEHAEALAIVNTELEQAAKDLERVRARVSNAPFKKPQEYSALELRKQLLSAVDEDADYLALTRASDQLERYGGAGHSRRRTEGMERMYDQVYYGELRKLANRYRIPLTEIEVKMGGLRSIDDADIRPEYMATHDFENATDVYEYMEAGYMDATQKSDALEGAADFGAWAEDMSQTIRNNPDVPSNSGRALINRIQRNSRKLEEVVTDLWDDANQDINGGPEKFTERAKPLEQAIKKDMEDLWDRYLRDLGPNVERPKTFPALELTPEVKDLIKETGVPIAQTEEQPEGPPVMAAALGGLIRKYQEGGPVRSLQAELEGTTLEEEAERYRRGELRRVQEKAEEDRKDAELRRRWEAGEPADQSTAMKYLKNTFRSLAGAVPFIDPSTRQWLTDTMTHLPSGAGQMLQSLQDDGTAKLMLPMPLEQPYPFMSEEALQSMMDYNEMARTHNAKIKPNIIDDTIAIAGLPGMFWPDTFGEPPEWAAEAMERSEQVSQDVRGDFGVPMPEGFMQGASEGLGMMLAQVPVPAAGGKTAATRLFDAAGRVMPRTAKAAKVATLPARAGLEFFNPVINPSMGNYLMGAGFAGAMNKGIQLLGGEGETPEEQLTEQELKYQQYATDTWMELDLEGKLDLISDPQVGDAAWYYLHPEEKELFLEELKEMGYDVAEEEEEPTEWAKGGYVSQLAKLRKLRDDGVIDATEVFEQKMLDDAIEDADLGDLAGEVDKPHDPYDPANISVTSREHLPPSPEFQEWLDDFQNKLNIKEAEHKDVMATMNFKYKPGDVVRGQLPNSRYEVLFQDFNRKTGRAKYRVIGEDGSEFDLPDFGIEGRAGPESNIHQSTGMDELAADAAEDFEEFTGFYPEDLELSEYLGRDNFEGKAFMEDGSEVRFTYDLTETDPRNRFEVKEDAE